MESDEFDAKNVFQFPRCEYRSKFKNTSAFEMTEEEYWGTYFRSNRDRTSKETEGKSYQNENEKEFLRNERLKKKSKNLRATKRGTMIFPWEKEGYSKIFHAKNEVQIHFSSSYLDRVLVYKKEICQYIGNEFIKKEKEEMKVYWDNQDVRIRIRVPKLTEFVGNQVSINLLYLLVRTFFVGITNYVARDKNVQIKLLHEMVSSNFRPSIDPSKHYFTMNIGLVPKIYAEVLVESLLILNDDFLMPLLNKNSNFQLDFTQAELEVINKQIQEYNNRTKENIEMWHSHENLIDVIKKENVLFHAMIKYRNPYKTISDYVYSTMSEQSSLAEPLRKILRTRTSTVNWFQCWKMTIITMILILNLMMKKI